jgi:hypothetical protein
MTPEIEGYRDQLLAIKQALPGLVNQLTDAQFNWRPAAGRWSIAQCLDHLNLTAAKFVPAMDAAIDKARQRGLLSQGPFSYPLLERWFAQSQEPPPGRRARAFKAFVPPPTLPRNDVISRFLDWQEQIDLRLLRADGVDLSRARHRSPILPLFTWRLGTMFALTLAHERRHLWQAQEVRIHSDFPAR